MVAMMKRFFCQQAALKAVDRHRQDAHIFPVAHFFQAAAQEGLKPADYPNLDIWEPSFLLIVDHLTPQLRGAASRSAFDPLECGVFRSIKNRYALGVTGNGSVPVSVQVSDTDPNWYGRSGVQTNGLSLCRALADRVPQGYLAKIDDGRTYGEALLDP